MILECPPSLGTQTKNGLLMSTGYVVPGIPDILSTWGIWQVLRATHRLATEAGRQLPALGIVATKVQKNNLHSRVLEDLRNGRIGWSGENGSRPIPPLFANHIPLTVAVARGAETDAGIRRLRGKYGDAYEPPQGLTGEIKDRCEKREFF